MKKRIKIFVFLLVFLIGISGLAHASGEEKLAYIIPVKEEITNATERYIDLSIEEAKKLKADMIVFELDTYGGRIDSTEKIKNHILNADIETTCFINSKAESAGVLIAISCDNIIMSPYGTIGSAETIPNTEKILSMWRSMLRNVAQNKGRDSQLVEAMADSDIKIEGLSEDGKLLNLTADEALEVGLIDGISRNLDEVLENYGLENAKAEVAKEDWATKIAKVASTQWISSLLLTIGFVGIVVEFFVPGFGIPGIIGAVSLLLFFGSNLLVGNASLFSIVLFIFGVILIIVEMFVPGFGLPGIGGIILTTFGLLTSMETLQQAFTSILLALIVATIAVIIIFKYGLNSRTFQSITLNSMIKGVSSDIHDESSNVRVGSIGVVLTGMRPTGYIEIDGEKVDATAESSFISKGSTVEVVGIEGSKIIVKEI